MENDTFFLFFFFFFFFIKKKKKKKKKKKSCIDPQGSLWGYKAPMKRLCSLFFVFFFFYDVRVLSSGCGVWRLAFCGYGGFPIPVALGWDDTPIVRLLFSVCKSTFVSKLFFPTGDLPRRIPWSWAILCFQHDREPKRFAEHFNSMPFRRPPAENLRFNSESVRSFLFRLWNDDTEHDRTQLRVSQIEFSDHESYAIPNIAGSENAILVVLAVCACAGPWQQSSESVTSSPCAHNLIHL